MSAISDAIQEMYIGYLGRAADKEGLAYWEAEVEAGNITLEQIRANITNEQPEYINGIGSLTRSQQVEAFYQNLFEREATEEDLAYWVSGGGSTVNADQLVLALINGATEIGGVDRLTLDNKLSAGNYYTEVAGGPDTYTKEDATAAVDGVDKTAQSVKASMDATDAGSNAQPEEFILTTGQDSVSTFGTDSAVVKGIVNGDTMGFLEETFTNFDSIQGNADTDMQLLVTGDGPGSFASINTIDELDFIGAGGHSASFDADGWTNIGAVNLAGGSGWLWVGIDDLEDGTDLAIESGISGSLSVDFASGLESWMSASEDSTVSFIAGDVLVDAADGETAEFSLDFTGDVEVGTVVGNAGDDDAYGWFSIDVSGDITAGDIELTVGSSTGTGDSYFSVTMEADGMITVGDMSYDLGMNGGADVELSGDMGVEAGNLTVVAGDGADIEFDAEADTGDILLGDFEVTAGSSASIDLSGDVDDYGSLTVGDIDVMAGDFSDVSVDFEISDSGDLTVGDTMVEVGDFSSVDIDFSADDYVNLLAGDVTVMAGDYADVDADFYVYSGDLELGNIDVGVGMSSDVDVSITNYYPYNTTGDQLAVGDISIAGEWNTDVEVDVYSSYSGGITLGNIDIMTSGTSDTASVSVTNYYSGDISIGNVTMAAGYYLNFNVENYYSSWVEDDVTIGDLDLSVGESGDLNAHIHNSATEYGPGSLTVGDVMVSIGNNASADLEFTNSGSDMSLDGGAFTIGDITIAAGADTDIDLEMYQSLDDSGDLGATTIGDINLSTAVGASFSIDIEVGISSSGTGDVMPVMIGDINVMGDDGVTGDVSVTVYNSGSGDIGDVTLGDRSLLLGVSGSGYNFGDYIYAYGGDIGNVTRGDIDLTLGKNSDSYGIDLWVDAYSGGNVGDVTVGDVDITLGVAADSSWISVSAYASSGDVGSLTVGDVTVSMDESSDLDSWFWTGGVNTGATVVGDFDVMMAGAGNYDAYVSGTAWSSGDAGSVTVGVITVNTTGDSDMYLLIDNVAYTGDAGDISVGNIDVDLALSSTVSITVDSSGLFTASGDGDGDISIGDLSIAGEGLLLLSVGDVPTGTAASTYTGDVTIGDITVALAGSGDLNTPTLDGILDGVGTAGTITVGDIDYSGYGTSTTIDVTGYLGAGNITGSAFDDMILDNAGTNIMTGGDGADIFELNLLNSNLLETNADQVTDFVTNVDKVAVTLVEGMDVNKYFESIYADYDAFIADAAVQMSAPGTDEDDIVAGEVGNTTWVAFDLDGDDTPDTVIGLQGVTIADLDFDDFLIS